MKITILGDGGWGTTLAIHLASKGYKPTLWGAFSKYVTEVEATRVNRKFLPGFHIPENVVFKSDLEESVVDAKLIILAVPSQYLRQVIQRVPKKKLKNKKSLCVTKGVESQSLKFMSQVVLELWGKIPFAVMSGPTIAREVALNVPTAVVVASKDKSMRTMTRNLFNTDHFTVYESQDIMGVQMGGSIKNVIAIAAGVVDGLGYGSNAKSVLIARGLAEMARLGLKMGAKRETFMGLSGLGDLVTTAFSIHSRNHACGTQLGEGKSLRQITRGTEMIIEGIESAKAAIRLAKKFQIEMPIVESVYNILFKHKSPRTTLEALMHKKLTRETD
jgi:glycerol-3-phosphate dehydrogenase (NAD(P)+)